MKTIIKRIIPAHFISRLVGKIASKNHFATQFLIKWFIKRYNVDLSLASRKKPNEYHTFNDFFTRELDFNQRKLVLNDKKILSPADGVVSAQGGIDKGILIQAKKHEYKLSELLANHNTDDFLNGYYSTIYLSPRDYHRVHVPVSAKLEKMIYIPGKLFSVNEQTTIDIPNLFALNERVVFIFETEFGKMFLVMVGAIIVASVSTKFQGVVAPNEGLTVFDYQDKNLRFNQGDELGQFLLGSTVVFGFSKSNFKSMVDLDTYIEMGRDYLEIK